MLQSMKSLPTILLLLSLEKPHNLKLAQKSAEIIHTPRFPETKRPKGRKIYAFPVEACAASDLITLLL